MSVCRGLAWMVLSEPQLYRRPPPGATARARTPLRCAFTVRTSRPSFVLQTLDHAKPSFLGPRSRVMARGLRSEAWKP